MARGGNRPDSAAEPIDWVTRAADDALRHAGGQEALTHGLPEGRVVTCASGASPSGPIHLGNLREFLTPHLVAEELRRRGVPVRLDVIAREGWHALAVKVSRRGDYDVRARAGYFGQ